MAIFLVKMEGRLNVYVGWGVTSHIAWPMPEAVKVRVRVGRSPIFTSYSRSEIIQGSISANGTNRNSHQGEPTPALGP
jgi:hypothetical protein